MARPQKSGLSYFPLQTDIYDSNSELTPLMGTYGSVGIGTYTHILCDIYKNGYYLKVAHMEFYVNIIAQKLLCDRESVEGAMNMLGELDILTYFQEDSAIIITSRGVQKRYLEVAKTRRHNIAELLTEVRTKYWILSDEETLSKIEKRAATNEQVLNEPKNSPNNYYGNNTVKTPVITVKTGYYGNNPDYYGKNPDCRGGYCSNNPVKTPQTKYIFPSLSSSESKSIKEVDDKYETMDRDSKLGYAEEIEFSDDSSLGNKDLDEFDEKTEREKREKELGEKLGLNPKLERMKPGEEGDPTTAPKLEFDLEGYERFSRRWGLKLTNTANLNGIVYEIKWDEVSRKLEQSKWLRERITMDFIFRHYREILDGRYDDYEKEKSKTGHELFMELINEMDNDESGGEKSGDEK